MLSIQLARTALSDIEVAASYYEAQAPLLGLKFKHAIEESIMRVQYQPHMYQIDFDDVRRAPVHRFPYAISYRVVGQIIYIDGVLHTKSHPENVKNALKKRQL